MVLWELTLGTAYFLGLRRTYRLALKIQRRLISPKHPKIRQFLHRRTHSVFHVAVSVHQKIQERDLEVGRNLGNWILRWLDQMKPSAQICVSNPWKPPSLKNTGYTPKINLQSSVTQGLNIRMADRDYSRGRLFGALWNIRPKSFPTIGMMMMRPMKPTSLSGQYYRHVSSPPEMKYWKGGFEGVFRRDIAQWMLQH